MSIKHYDWIAHHAANRGNKVAVVDLDTGREIRYKELEERAVALARWFKYQGIKKGDRVAVLMRNAPEFFEIQFACHKIGAICVPLNWRLTQNELSYILNDSGPELLIYEDCFNETALPVLKALSLIHISEPTRPY